MSTEWATAILWWRQLLSELGRSSIMKSPGEEGRLAARRVTAVRELFFSLLDELPTDCLLEIGAYDAQASRRFVASKPGARAVAYEAARENFEQAIRGGLPDQLEMVNKAIGLRSGDVTFFLPLDDRARVWGSTRRRVIDAVPVRELSVPMTTLEEAGRGAVSEGEERSLALWIDVEGAALDVLVSGSGLVKDRVAAIYVEVNDDDVYEGAGTAIEVLQFLLGSGFVPLARDNQFAHAWNLLAVHESAYLAARVTIARWFYRSLAP